MERNREVDRVDDSARVGVEVVFGVGSGREHGALDERYLASLGEDEGVEE